MDLRLTDGVTAPLAEPPRRSGACTVLERAPGDGRLRQPRLLSDLGELVPAHLTTGRPAAPREALRRRRRWRPGRRSPAPSPRCAPQGVRVRERLAVRARSRCPTRAAPADWVCTRAETWRGDGTRVLAQFHTPGGQYGAVAAKAENVAGLRARAIRMCWPGCCGSRGRVPGTCLPPAREDTASITATGGVSASARGALLAARPSRGPGRAEGDPEGRAGDRRVALAPYLNRSWNVRVEQFSRGVIFPLSVA